MRKRPVEMLTIGRIARRLQVPMHRVDYAIRTRRIRPVARAGTLRVFAVGQLDLIRAAVKSCRSQPARRKPYGTIDAKK